MATSSIPLTPLSTFHHNPTEPRRHHHHHHHHPPPLTHNSQVPDRQNPQIPPPKTRTIRSRLSQLCCEGRPDIARHVFDALPRPTTVLWNTIIIGFICNGMPNEALLFYSRMKWRASSKYDSYTYSSVLKACAETRQLRIGKAVHCHVLRSNLNPSQILSNSLLNMYSCCSEVSPFDLAQKVFDTMRKRNIVAWNTMISWYVKTKRFAEAINGFKLLMKMGIKPTVVTFISVFPAISELGDYKTANAIYGLLLKMGSDYFSDLFAVSSAIFMYSELGYTDIAREIFDFSMERNTEVWNTMIGGYVQNNCHVEGLELFLEALEMDQTVFDDVTYLSALTAVSQLQGLDLGHQLHGYIIKNSKALSIVILNATIVMYSRCNSIANSFTLFEKMTERDTVSWNTMVSAFVQNGFDDEGLMLVYEMQKQGFGVDSVTVTALLSAASNLRNPELGKQIHAYVFRHGIYFEGMDSYLIDMYAKSGLIHNAKLVFEENHAHDRDQATWNAVIAGYTQNGLIEEAFDAFRQMVERNLVPNAVTLASILPACNLVGNISSGKELHGFAMRHGLDENVFVSTALIDMYSKSGVITCAETVFDKMPDSNSVTYTTMILGYGQHGVGERALSLFHSMQGRRIKPDAITFVAVLSACSYSGLVDEGLLIFESMEREYMIKPSSEHFCCVVDMLGRVGRVVEAYEFVKDLGEKGNILGIWGSLLGACRIHGEYELGKVVAEKLIEMERGEDVAGYHVLLSNIYAEEGKWENVDRVRKVMREKGLRKDAGCSWIEVSGGVNRFLSRDRDHPKLDDISEMLEVLAVEMKGVGYRPSLVSNFHEISDSDG